MGRSSIIEIPPPEQRLCKKHRKPICPSSWKQRCRTNQCSECKRERAKSPEARKRREIKWEKEFIPCVKHITRRCGKSRYIHDGGRRCSSCHSKLKDGSSTPTRKRQQGKRNYKVSVERRKYFRGTMRGLKLFERSTGFNLEQVGFTRKEINAQNI